MLINSKEGGVCPCCKTHYGVLCLPCKINGGIMSTYTKMSRGVVCVLSVIHCYFQEKIN